MRGLSQSKGRKRGVLRRRGGRCPCVEDCSERANEVRRYDAWTATKGRGSPPTSAAVLASAPRVSARRGLPPARPARSSRASDSRCAGAKLPSSLTKALQANRKWTKGELYEVAVDAPGGAAAAQSSTASVRIALRAHTHGPAPGRQAAHARHPSPLPPSSSPAHSQPAS